MALDIRKGQRLPYFRLATLGGVSTARDDFFGRPALYFGWASWHPSRAMLPALQDFYAAHRDRLAIVSIAFDVQGPELPMRYLRAAGYSFPALIDGCGELTRLWGVRDLPFAALVDERGIVLSVADAPEASFLADVLKTLKRKPEPRSPREKAIDHPLPAKEILLQSCANFLGRGRTDDALQAMQRALELDPADRMIRPQMLAIQHPERFHSGAIDADWLRRQIDARLPKTAKTK